MIAVPSWGEPWDGGGEALNSLTHLVPYIPRALTGDRGTQSVRVAAIRVLPATLRDPAWSTPPGNEPRESYLTKIKKPAIRV